MFTTVGVAAEKRKLEGSGKKGKAKAKAKAAKNEHNAQSLARMKSEALDESYDSTAPTEEPDEEDWDGEDWDDEAWDAD